MKIVYLMRHAKAASDSPTFEDRDRALNARGNEDAPRMAAEMKARSYIPDLILCSSARRTQETCRHVLDVLGPDIPTVFDPGLYLASDEEILETIHAANPAANAALVIGHNPGLEDLAVALAAQGGPPKFPTAALAVFRFDAETWPQIARRKGAFADYLTPKMLKD
jgi:phosphohistidine phosphatase